jgi:hypothetical protein
MGRRPDDTAELNFDGLTDTVTNLAAGLVLVNVLMLGIFQNPKKTARQVNPNQRPQVGVVIEESQRRAENEAGPKPIHPLLREVETLRQMIAGIDRDITLQEAQVVELRRQAEDVLKQATPTSPTASAPANPESSK